MKIAIIGATGHIGINMTIALARKGFSIKAICRSPQKMKVINEFNINTVKGNILDPSVLNRELSDIDTVINLAGKISINGDPDGSVMQTNVAGTENIVAACLNNNVKKYIHFSSVHAFKYNRHTPIVNEEIPYADTSSFKYDQSKALGEKEVLKGIKKGLNATIICPTAVIGPHDYFNSRSGEMLINLFTGKMPAIVYGGFDWVDVRDIISAVIYILENGAASSRYLLSGHWASFTQLANICQKITGIRSAKIVLPVGVGILGLPFIQLARLFSKKPPLYTYESLMIIKNANRNYSSALAKKELNYKVRPLEESIEDIYKWWKENKQLTGVTQV
ncbi:MAG: NAD-dependent epimerase/dehydratase family protein [Bacteroidota bacterium]